MNFLLHHHLAERDLGSLAAGAAMLPDLWRMADRRVHARRDAAAGDGEASDVRDVLAGVRHHLDADRWFHATDVFRRGELNARRALSDAAPEARRIGLFGHAVWEICLDGALLRRRGARAVLADVSASLAAIGRGVASPAERAADIHHFDRVPRLPDDRLAFTRGMGRLVDALTEGSWIAGYESGAGIAAHLDGMRARLRSLAPLDVAERARVGRSLDALLDEADAALRELLAAAPD